MRISLLLAGALISQIALAADPTVFADWGIGNADDKSFVFAATINDSGEGFGEYCYFKSGTCSWILGLHTKCESGATGIVLTNSASGSVALDVNCLGQAGKDISGKDLYSYVFTDWKSLESNMKDVSRIGFAFALASEQFNVVRFSLKGRTDSTTAMETYFFAQVKSRKQGTVDEKL